MCFKNNIQVFNTEGEFLLKFGSNGEGNGQFNAPTGVAVDANGNIIVADWGNSRIQVGDRESISPGLSEQPLFEETFNPDGWRSQGRFWAGLKLKTLVGLVAGGDESAFRDRDGVQRLAAWCARSNLLLHTLRRWS